MTVNLCEGIGLICVQKRRKNMFDKIVVAVCVIVCLTAGIWGWWLENGPSKNAKKEEEEPMEKSEDNAGKKEE